MEYRNPEIPEGINTSQEHPLKELALLLGGLLGLVVLIVTGLALSAEYLAGKIPFETEQRLAAGIPLEAEALPPAAAAAGTRLRGYLQELADALAAAEQLPPGMSVTVHYLPGDTVNAFATLGGNLVFYRGLLEKMPDENTLAMVMAHEIAHIKLRHPVRSLGRGVVIGIALSVVSAAVGDRVVETVLGDSGLLTMLHFSRRQEAAADAEALAALAGYYGHVGGAGRLFELLEATHGTARPPAFFSTHPVSEDRIRALQALAAARGWPSGEPRSLPAGFSEWLAATAAAVAACAPAGEAGPATPEPMPKRRCPN